MTAQVAGKAIERYPGSNRWLLALQAVGRPLGGLLLEGAGQARHQ
ncbi:hypothetical protein [Streptomyces platensis]|nr:hypothetical protein [Streptomyces platensis]